MSSAVARHEKVGPASGGVAPNQITEPSVDPLGVDDLATEIAGREELDGHPRLAARREPRSSEPSAW